MYLVTPAALSLSLARSLTQGKEPLHFVRIFDGVVTLVQESFDMEHRAEDAAADCPAETIQLFHVRAFLEDRSLVRVAQA